MERVQALASYIVDKSVDHFVDIRPDIQRGGKSPWWHDRALLAMDFVRGRYVRRGINVSQSAAITVDRDSQVLRPDASGFLMSYDVDELAQVFGVGVHVDGALSNKIRNPRGEGGTPGIIGSGGALPTGWAFEAIATGLNCEFLGVVDVDDLSRVRIRIFGTSISTSEVVRIRFDQSTNATATAGQAWGLDFDAQLVAGVSPNVSARITEFNGATSINGGAGVIGNPLTSIRTRRRASGVMNNAATTNVRAALYMSVLNTVIYDFTVDLFAPKLVQLPVIEGPELVVNGDFASGVGWSFTGAGWNIGAGKANAVAASSGDRLYRDISVLAANKVFKTSLALSNYANGAAYSALSGSAAANGTPHAANGTFVEYLLAAGTTSRLSIYTNFAPTNLSVDDFSVKEVSSGHMPSFPILPPVGLIEESVKMADDVRASDLSWLPQSGASELVLIHWSHVAHKQLRTLFEYSDGTAENFICAYVDGADQPSLRIVRGGVEQAQINLAQAVTLGLHAFAFGWTSAGCYIVDGQGNMVSSGPLSLPIVTQKRIGGSLGGHFLNDVIEAMQVCHPIEAADAADWTCGILA